MIQDLKELQQLIKLCRKFGVIEIALPTMSMKLTETAPEKQSDETAEIPNGMPVGPTEEQLLNWSISGPQHLLGD